MTTYYKVSDGIYDGPPQFTEFDSGSFIELGRMKCKCCVLFATRRSAKNYELSLLRIIQKNILTELADCENRIVTVMRELS
jgi:hypothetical protein